MSKSLFSVSAEYYIYVICIEHFYIQCSALVACIYSMSNEFCINWLKYNYESKTIKISWRKVTEKLTNYIHHHIVSCESRSVVSDSLWPHGLYSPWNSPGENTGVGSLSLLQGIFPPQGSSPGLLHCRRILYQLSHKESPRILGWVAYPFSSGSYWPRNWTGISGIAGRFLTNWTIREALYYHKFFFF